MGNDGRFGYYGFYETTTPIPVKDGISSKSKRGGIGDTWWSKRWIAVLESFNMGARLGRGKNYARKGQVVSIDVKPGLVVAKVQGSTRTPYSVEMTLDPLDEEQWGQVADNLASRALFAAQLLNGEMPKDIEEAFQESKISLFPKRKGDLDTECSCPDWANPCKHIAAVYYLLAERFDEDPFLLFTLRGWTKEQVLEALRARRTQVSQGLGISPAPEARDEGMAGNQPLEECLERFWTAGSDLEKFALCFEKKEQKHAVLRILGPAPFLVRRKNLALLLEPVYDLVSREALKKAKEE